MNDLSSKSILFLAALCALPAGGFAKNPICDNTESIFVEKCFAFNDDQSLEFFKYIWPTFPDGTKFKSTGTRSWSEIVQRIPQNDDQDSVWEYTCRYKVVPKAKLPQSIQSELRLYQGNVEYAVYYDSCRYEPKGLYKSSPSNDENLSDSPRHIRQSGFIEGSSGIGEGTESLPSGGIATKSKGTIKTPSARDIDMGAGGSPRSAADIMKVVRQRTPGLRHIYNKYLKQKPGFAGKVTLRITIDPSGDIISIAIASSTTDYSEFDNVVKNTVKRWKFSKIKSGNATVTIPFTFAE